MPRDRARLHVPLAPFTLRVRARLARAGHRRDGARPARGRRRCSRRSRAARRRPRTHRGRRRRLPRRRARPPAARAAAGRLRAAGRGPLPAPDRPRQRALRCARPRRRGWTRAVEVLGLGAAARAACRRRSPAARSSASRSRARSRADPVLLLLDEPLGGLDAALRERILPYLLRVRDEWNVPILYVTHNAGEALALAGEVLLLERGRGARGRRRPRDLLAAPAMAPPRRRRPRERAGRPRGGRRRSGGGRPGRARGRR